MTYILQITIDLGCIFGMLALGVFLSFRILNIPDLSIDATFVLGNSIAAVFVQANQPILGLIIAVMGGMVSGSITGILHTKGKIQPILAGIITMTGLYSINSRILGNKANLSLFHASTIFTALTSLQRTIFLMLFSLLVTFFLYWLLTTRLGMSLRATGDNEAMVTSSSINIDTIKIIGLSISNGIVALAGGLMSQYQNFADLNGGIGMMVIAMVSIILSEAIYRAKTPLPRLLMILVGATSYRALLTLAMQLGMQAIDLKIISALLLTFVLVIPKGGYFHARNQ